MNIEQKSGAYPEGIPFHCAIKINGGDLSQQWLIQRHYQLLVDLHHAIRSHDLSGDKEAVMWLLAKVTEMFQATMDKDDNRTNVN